MPTQDDQRVVQFEAEKADARFWETLRDVHAERAEGNKGVTATVARNIAEDEAGAAAAAAKLKAATERVAKIERGEDVGTIPKPMTSKEMSKVLGMTAAEIRRCQCVAELGEGVIPKVVAASMKRSRRAEYTAVRAMLRRQRSARRTAP